MRHVRNEDDLFNLKGKTDLAPLVNSEPRARNWSVFDLENAPDQITLSERSTSPDSSSPNLDRLIQAAESQGAGYRKGKWSSEEIAYASFMLKHFELGTLNLTAGTTLRSYLSKQLRCDPMRISKKLAGGSFNGMPIAKKLGKRLYIPAQQAVSEEDKKMVEDVDKELNFLEDKFLHRVQKENLLEKSASQVLKRRRKLEKALKLERCGPWVPQEEEFLLKLIEHFMDGLLNVPKGTTLRSYLAAQLRCDPMRISKKLTSPKLRNYTIPKRIGTTSFVGKRTEVNEKDCILVDQQVEAARQAFYTATGLKPLPTSPKPLATRKRTLSEGNMSPASSNRAAEAIFAANWNSNMVPSSESTEASLKKPRSALFI